MNAPVGTRSETRGCAVGAPGNSTHRARPDYNQFHSQHRGFSLMELIVVLAVVTILTSLLMPALNKLRENVHKVVCASNLRQIAVAKSIYAADHYDNLPPSINLSPQAGIWEPQELMVSRTPRSDAPGAWDGFGLLFKQGYCGSFECFYCPSHTGQHPLSRYADRWHSEEEQVIYTNYHYSGDRDWQTGMRRFFVRPSTLVIATDGLRTASDINHQFGVNAAYGDGSVRWRPDMVTILDLLPKQNEAGNTNPVNSEKYNQIWSILEDQR